MRGILRTLGWVVLFATSSQSLAVDGIRVDLRPPEDLPNRHAQAHTVVTMVVLDDSSDLAETLQYIRDVWAREADDLAKEFICTSGPTLAVECDVVRRELDAGANDASPTFTLQPIAAEAMVPAAVQSSRHRLVVALLNSMIGAAIVGSTAVMVRGEQPALAIIPIVLAAAYSGTTAYFGQHMHNYIHSRHWLSLQQAPGPISLRTAIAKRSVLSLTYSAVLEAVHYSLGAKTGYLQIAFLAKYLLANSGSVAFQMFWQKTRERIDASTAERLRRAKLHGRLHSSSTLTELSSGLANCGVSAYDLVTISAGVAVTAVWQVIDIHALTHYTLSFYDGIRRGFKKTCEFFGFRS